MLVKLFPKSKPPMLGRWGNNLNDTQKSINSVWTNSDHCGDIICGKPELIQKNRVVLSQKEEKVEGV